MKKGTSGMEEAAQESRWQNALLPADATLQHAIRNLDESGLQIALVVAADGRLLGTLTDGDIRRGLLRNLKLDSSIESVMYREPIVVPAQLDRSTVLQLMQVNRIHQLPIVDEQRRVIGLHLWDKLMMPAERSNLMVIMAGGRGMRLRPHTEHCPKPMLPVAGKPMLEHIIERAKAEGFRHFALAIHYLGNMIEDYFEDGGSRGVHVEYLREKTPLGTVGAVGLLNPRPDEPFVISNGDVLTDIRYGEVLDFHCNHSAAATMAVRLHEWEHPYGVVRTKGVDIVGFEEKPIARSYVNAGIYVVEPFVLDALQVGEPCDTPTLFGRLQDRGLRTIAYPMHEPWLDVGRPDDYDLVTNGNFGVAQTGKR